jgi:hypothetical protein
MAKKEFPEGFEEALTGLCNSYDAEYGEYPESCYEGKALLQHYYDTHRVTCKDGGYWLKGFDTHGTIKCMISNLREVKNIGTFRCHICGITGPVDDKTLVSVLIYNQLNINTDMYQPRLNVCSKCLPRLMDMLKLAIIETSELMVAENGSITR